MSSIDGCASYYLNNSKFSNIEHEFSSHLFCDFCGLGGSSQEDHSSVEKVQSSLTSDDNVQICTDHDQCVTRRERIKTCKGFMAKEPVKGHMASSTNHRCLSL